MRPVRVFILGQHQLFCDSLKALLQGQPKIRVVGATCDHERAASRVKTLRPDVIIVDETLGNLPAGFFLRLIEQTMQFIHISLEHNTLTLHRAESVDNADVEELIAWLRSSRRKTAGSEAGHSTRSKSSVRSKE